MGNSDSLIKKLEAKRDVQALVEIYEKNKYDRYSIPLLERVIEALSNIGDDSAVEQLIECLNCTWEDIKKNRPVL